MFNFKTGFFDHQPVEEIQKNVDLDQEIEPQEVEAILFDSDQFEQQEAESLLAEVGEDEQIEEEQIQVESSVSEVQVFHHPKNACVDINGGNVQSCINSENIVTGISDVIVKIPVVLAEFQVQVNMASYINLPEKALEIKEIKKRVKLTQCLLLQEPGVVANPGDIFLKGFVRKNIAYATRDCSNEEGVCGDIRHCTVDVPFSCVTKVMFNGTMPLPPIANTITEFEYFRRQNLNSPCFAEKDQLLAGDFSEFNQVSQEFFNELPFCELISSKIVEFDEFINRTRPKHAELPFEEREFSQIQEKMILTLTIKLLQNRQVYIPPAYAPVHVEISQAVNYFETLQPKEIAPVVLEEYITAESEPDFSEDIEGDHPIEVITDNMVNIIPQEEIVQQSVEDHLTTDVSVDSVEDSPTDKAEVVIDDQIVEKETEFYQDDIVIEEASQETNDLQPVDAPADTDNHWAIVAEAGVSTED